MQRRHWNIKFWKPEVLARLKEPGCPVCAHISSEIVRDFFWFLNESYYEGEVIADLQRSYGFCPFHTRHLLETGGNSVITTVFSYLTAHSIARLQEAQGVLTGPTTRENAHDRCRRAAKILRPQSVCRGCRAAQWWEKHITGAISQTLTDAEAEAAYKESHGFCLPHFHQAGLLADWDALSVLAEDMRRRLQAVAISNGVSIRLFEQIAGLDRQRPFRARDRKRRTPNLPVHAPEQGVITLNDDSVAVPWSPTFEQALAALAEPSCPVCAACERGALDYIRWLAREMETKALSSGNWDLSWKVCPEHFWDLYASGHERAATAVGERLRQDWLSKLETLTARMAKRPPDSLVGRLAAVPAEWSRQLNGGKHRASVQFLWRVAAGEMQSPERRLDLLRAPQFREDVCQACWHMRETAHRMLDLILRVVEDPTGRQSYHQSWGLCLRHCIMAASVAENPAALSEVLKAQIPHLRILEWELDEVSRKHNWSVRYEPAGPEAGAWERAAHQFCGTLP
jgi:hypothetical protein